MYRNENNNLIPLYYYWYDNDEICISGKEYVEAIGEYADGANGENGVVYDQFKNEPYSYFSEIADIMDELDYEELSEGIFSMEESSISELFSKMEARGFELIFDANQN